MPNDEIELVCRELVELVTEYLGGTLSAENRARLEQHLSSCPPCTAYLAQMTTTLELAAELGAPDELPDEQAADRLGELFRDWHRAKRR
jgi:anti-sigma factor RsiW